MNEEVPIMRIAMSLVVAAVLIGQIQISSASDVDRLGKRILWTTSRIHGTPDPPPPYQTKRAFANLTFDEPLSLVNAPGTDRMFVAERFGKVYSFRKHEDVEQADVCLDVNSTIFGLAVHPDVASNGYIYISYLNPLIKGHHPLAKDYFPTGTRVSRFKMTSFDPPRCDLDSELALIKWPCGGHNGGCLKFGPDGYLYISLGDSSDIADQRETGQDLSDLYASILRIDVDSQEEGRAYGIPPDNPFVNVPRARPEIWAYGVRQVWRMNFDRVTGELWGGEIGQDLWESVLLIQRGGNYGWSVTEGSHAFRPERKRGPSPILAPIHEYNHTEGRSITGGYVYRGSRLKELVGAYIFADYDSGRVWGLRCDGSDVVWHEKLCESRRRIVSFGEDDEGECYLVDHVGGGLYSLVPTEEQTDDQDFPRTLSETGLFSSVPQLTPAPGVIPFSINAPSWADGVQKQWYLAIPDDKQIEFDGIKYPDSEVPAGWKFPDGAVIVETINLEMQKGDPASLRHLETRILHHEKLPGDEEMGDQYWNGYTYVWNDEQTDALLLDSPNGLDRTYSIRDPDNVTAPGSPSTLKWHFPSRDECTVCHNMSAKYILSGNTLQLNKDHDYGDGVVVNQIRAFQHWGLFDAPLPTSVEQMDRLVESRDQSHDLEHRARAYLHANCAFCHRKWGGGNAEFKVVYTLDLNETGILGAEPAHGTFQLPDARLVVPGDPYRSILFYRLAKLGRGRMPRAGSQTIDTHGLRLIHDWIAQLPSASAATHKSTDAEDAIRAAQSVLREPSSESEARQAADALLHSTRGAFVLSWTLDEMPVHDRRRDKLIAMGAEHPIPDVRDLFERFLPEERRTQRLGTVIDTQKILALDGNAARGRELFLSDGVQCKGCHQVHGTNIELGPNLSEIGKKYDPAQLLATIVEPSQKIDPQFLALLVVTSDGKTYTGLIKERGQEEVVLITADKKTIRLATDDVETIQPQTKSFMPDLLLRDLTARDAADLLAYLSSLK